MLFHLLYCFKINYFTNACMSCQKHLFKLSDKNKMCGSKLNELQHHIVSVSNPSMTKCVPFYLLHFVAMIHNEFIIKNEGRKS